MTKDRLYLGRLVELCGNKWRMDGCGFNLSNQAIETRLKSRFVIDVYEKPERILVKRHVEPSLPAIELGGSIGAVACVTSRLLEDPRQHLVVEANPDLIEALDQNRSMNNCEFSVLHAALAYHHGSVEFFQHERFVGGSVQRKTGRSVQVNAVTLSDLLKTTGFSKINLIADIEGAELELIHNEPRVLQEHVAIAIIEVHPGIINTEEEVESAHTVLLNHGFKELDRIGIVRVYRNTNLLPL